jgi:hypothetical protein
MLLTLSITLRLAAALSPKVYVPRLPQCRGAGWSCARRPCPGTGVPIRCIRRSLARLLSVREIVNVKPMTKVRSDKRIQYEKLRQTGVHVQAVSSSAAPAVVVHRGRDRSVRPRAAHRNCNLNLDDLHGDRPDLICEPQRARGIQRDVHPDETARTSTAAPTNTHWRLLPITC